MIEVKIATKVVKQLRDSEKNIGILADTASKHPDTIKRWLDNNDIMLTTWIVLDAIKQITGLAENKILVKQEV